MRSVTWVKAHQATTAIVRGGNVDLIKVARGNESGDTVGSKGRLFHPEADAEVAARVKWQVAHATAAAKVMAATLPLWSRVQHFKRRTKSETVRGWATEAPDPLERHTWKQGSRHWHCTQCLRHARGVTPSHMRAR